MTDRDTATPPAHVYCTKGCTAGFTEDCIHPKCNHSIIGAPAPATGVQDEIASCPFCGDDGCEINISTCSTTNSQKKAVYCNSCFSEGPPRKTDAEAIATWNRRATPAVPAQEPVAWAGHDGGKRVCCTVSRDEADLWLRHGVDVRPLVYAAPSPAPVQDHIADADKMIEAPQGALEGWQPIETAPKYTQLRLFSEGFIHEDFNPGGSVEGQWFDDLGWIGAVWNPEQDVWDTNEIVPTHWMPIPAAPQPPMKEGHDELLRWSSDDYQSDVYCYASVGDFFAIHVAGNRVTPTAPRPPSIGDWWKRGDKGIAEYMAREQAVNAWLATAERKPIGLAHDGDNFEEPDAAAAADRLEYLRGLGYNVPQGAIDALRAEAKEPQ